MADLDSFALDLEAAIEELSKATPKPKRRRGGAKAAKPSKAKAKASAANGGRAKPRREAGTPGA